MSSEPFLSRWSRRKQEVRKSEQPDSAALPQPPEAEARGAETSQASSPRTVSGQTGTSEAELSAEEIAALPSLDELTVGTDITVFLRKGVPERLRNAALRRMWSLDPNIRDFVSEAREYAYDWNTPGGVPGFGGELPPADEIRRLAEQIVGAVRPSTELRADAGEPANCSHIRERAQSDPEPPESAGSAQSPTVSGPPQIAERRYPQESLSAQPLGGSASEPDDPPASERAGLSAAKVDAEPTRRRQHGGAKPL